MLWVRSKTWSECRPFAGNKEMNLGYQDSLVTPLATVTVTEMELAEAFLEQQNEGPQPIPTAPDPKDDTIEEGVVAGRPALSIHDKPKGKGKNDDKGKGKGKGRPRSGTQDHLVPLPGRRILCRQIDIWLHRRVYITPFKANLCCRIRCD